MSELDDACRRCLPAARAAWPEVAIPDDAFVAHLAARAGSVDTLATLRTQDVYLALACARGDATAIAIFEETYFGEIERAGKRSRASADLVDEVRGTLRKQLFVGDDNRPAACLDYTGRGDLRGWIRVIAMREMVRVVKRAGRNVPVADDALFDVLSPGADPELAYIRELYRSEVEESFRVALAALSSRDRSLLRYLLVDGLTTDAIGALHGVHRATAGRWLADARASLKERTLAELANRLGAAPAELESIVRLVRSRIDVSIELD